MKQGRGIKRTTATFAKYCLLGYCSWNSTGDHILLMECINYIKNPKKSKIVPNKLPTKIRSLISIVPQIISSKIIRKFEIEHLLVVYFLSTFVVYFFHGLGLVWPINLRSQNLTIFCLFTSVEISENLKTIPISSQFIQTVHEVYF